MVTKAWKVERVPQFNMEVCFFSLISRSQPRECLLDLCGFWDSNKNCCSLEYMRRKKLWMALCLSLGEDLVYRPDNNSVDKSIT